MTDLWIPGLWFCWGVVGWWGLLLGVALLNRLFVPHLTTDSLPDDALPHLSVLIPARNEEADLEEALRSHLTQDYPRMEVVVCDDGSTDATPAILEKLQREFPRLQVVRGAEVLPGWLGKPNAQRQALEKATGEVLLFVDADVVYSPGTHRRAASELVHHGAHMVALLGSLEAKGFEPLILSFLNAFATYCGPLFLANAPRFRSVAVGGGPGNLVNRAAFEAAGGMEALREEVIDDVAMGRMMKAYRGRYRLVVCPDALRVRMYRGFGASFEGFTKNLYSAFGRRLWIGALSFCGDLAVHLLPVTVLGLSFILPALAPLRLPATLAVGAGVLCNGLAALWTGAAWWMALAFPVRSILWTVMFFRSAWVYHTRGVVWRGRAFR